MVKAVPQDTTALRLGGTVADRDVLLRADSLVKSFGGLKAVHEVSLQVSAGHILGLIGANGAGKSTIVNLIAGVLRPDGGSVALDGKDITDLAAHERARQGLIRTFQRTTTFPLLCGTDVVMTGLSSSADDSFASWLATPWRAKRRRKALEQQARQQLSRLGLDSANGPASVGVLAPGTNRMLGFAVALAAKPRMLVLDEPGAGLSMAERTVLSDRIREVANSGVGLLIIEHDVSFIMRTCDRVLAVDHGVVIADGLPDEVRAHSAVRQAYLGDADVAS